MEPSLTPALIGALGGIAVGLIGIASAMFFRVFKSPKEVGGEIADDVRKLRGEHHELSQNVAVLANEVNHLARTVQTLGDEVRNIWRTGGR